MEPLNPRQPSPEQEIQSAGDDREALDSTLSSPNKVNLDDLPERVAEHVESEVTPAKIGISIFIVACFFLLVLAGLVLALYALFFYI